MQFPCYSKDCLILPPTPVELESIGKLADLAVAAGPAHPAWGYFQFVKGLAEYRQGHGAAAIEWLKNINPSRDWPRAVEVQMVLALAQHQLQQFEAARATLSRGLQLAADKLGDADRTDLDDTWNDWLIARCLLREARAAVSGTAGNAPASTPPQRAGGGPAAKAPGD